MVCIWRWVKQINIYYEFRFFVTDYILSINERETKLIFHFKEFVKTLRIGEYYGSEKAVRIWSLFQPHLTRMRSYVSGVSRQEEPVIWEMMMMMLMIMMMMMSRQEEHVIWEMASRDLAALSLWLGTKEFFHGSEPSSLDCTVFGNLVQFLFIDIGFPQKV